MTYSLTKIIEKIYGPDDFKRAHKLNTPIVSKLN